MLKDRWGGASAGKSFSSEVCKSFQTQQGGELQNQLVQWGRILEGKDAERTDHENEQWKPAVWILQDGSWELERYGKRTAHQLTHEPSCLSWKWSEQKVHWGFQEGKAQAPEQLQAASPVHLKLGEGKRSNGGPGWGAEQRKQRTEGGGQFKDRNANLTWEQNEWDEAWAHQASKWEEHQWSSSKRWL
jgi:hypothetical protein